MSFIRKTWEYVRSLSLVQQIIIGICLGLVLGLTVPGCKPIATCGTLFVSALKAIAPFLVFFLVIDSLSHHNDYQATNIKGILVLYVISMLLAGIAAVFISLHFSPTLVLHDVTEQPTAPSQLYDVVHNLLIGCVQNPLEAIIKANYISILFWAVIFGLTARNAGENLRADLKEIAALISKVIVMVIHCAPIGVMGLMFSSITSGGVSTLVSYGQLVLILVGTMLVAALIINPLLVFFTIRQNPYPLVFRCLRDSGVTAFFTRSSAANIPVNMAICQKMGLDPATYSVSIPLGAAINCCGAAITITTMTLATVHTMNIHVSVGSAILMCIMATVSACGSSSVAGGSLLLIPLACSMFGISNDIAMQVVGIGFIIGVIQDSCETALNSSSDLLFTATADIASRKKKGQVEEAPKS